MLGTMKDPTLFLLLSSVGILLFGSIGYGIYTTVGPSSYKLRDTIKEHARMHELGIAHGHNHHNHNEEHHIHWIDINVYIFYWLSINNRILLYYNPFWKIIIVLYFSIFWLTNQNAVLTKQ